MKILVSADMEGCTGVVNWDQVTPGHAEYARYRKIMTGDVNAALRGAFDAGADEIVVVDGHWAGANILVEELDPRARLISGSPAPLSMMQGIDHTFDAVFFAGYHARHGTPNAILDHTWSSRSVANLWLNEILTGEYGLNAALAGQFGVPVILITGDQTACAQASELIGDLESAVVKQACGRFSAECLVPRAAHEQIYLAAARAAGRLLEGNVPDPLEMDLPIRVRLEFFASHMAERAALLPHTQRNGRLISFQADSMLEAYSSFRAAVLLAGE